MAKSNKWPLSRIVLDEIALEGLEGITIPSLWVYLSAALEIPLPLGEQLESQIWSFILSAERHLLFYVLPKERPVVKLFNRFENLDPFLGVPVQPNECPYPRYKWAPVTDADIFGSCEFYKERNKIKIKDLLELSVEDVLRKWGSKFVIVGTQELRYNALTPENVAIPKELTLMQYCLWEIIGRSRHNGESTAGTWSLQQFCKDSTFVFYMKARLLHFGLVSCLTYNEKRGDRLHASTLVTLPRFYSMHKSVFNSVIEKLFEVLKETPRHRIEYCNARKYFPQILETAKAFKKISMTHVFRKIFDVVNVPITEADDLVKITPTMRKERLVLVLQLKNPNMSIHKELYAENNDAENNEESSEFCNDKHAFVDMPVLDEFCRAVERHGPRGCSHSDICNYMATQHVNVRQYVKKGLADGLITSYSMDVGRQRTNMLVTAQNALTVKEEIKTSMVTLKNLKCAEEPNLPDDNVVCQDTPSISGKIQLYEYDVGINARETTTRQTQRKALVIQTIDAQGIVPVIDLRNIIHKHEMENGYKDEVCRKSVRRMLGKLSKLNLIKVYEIILQADETIRIHRYVTHPKITAEHKVLQVEMLRLKNNLYLTLEEKRFRQNTQAKRRTAALSKLKVQSSKEECKELLLSLSTHKSPKFLVSRYLHVFLFYVCYNLESQCEPIAINEKLVQRWQLTEPNIVIKDYLETLKLDNKNANINAYTEEIGWRTFIPPLPIYPEKPRGWLVLVDAVIDRIPLSFFNKIFRLDKLANPRITEYLEHPIRQHYLVKQLPSDMQAQISRAKLQTVYIRVMKLLNNMGLIQAGLRQQKDPLQMWIYLNRHAEILDTTTTEASYAKINPNLNYTTLSYVFEETDDIHQYWTTLYRICVHTRLGFLKVTLPRRQPGKNPYVNFLGTINFDEAPQNDDRAHVPGDRLGAAGLSSHLFAHTFRNWSWVVQTDCKPKVMPKGRQTRTAYPKIIKQNRKKMTKSGIAKLSVVPLKRLQMRTIGTSSKRITTTVPKKKVPQRDAIDRDAIKNMRCLRVSWSVEEDDVLKMARAVFLYLSAPILLLNFISIGKICRDVMRHTLGSFNKTAQACVRRCTFIVKMNRHLPQVPAWLHMLQTNEQIQAQYGDSFIKNLRKVYTNRSELSSAVSIHFILLLNALYKLINCYELTDRPKFLIPDTITEFRKKLREYSTAQQNRVKNYENPKTESDLHVAIITNVLHSSLCSARDKTLYNLQAFEIYKNFSEEVLHEAFQRAHNDGLVIAIKRKNLQTVQSQITGPTYLFSQKYRMRLTFLKIPYGVYDSFFSFFANTIETVFGPHTSASPAKSIELKSPNAGHLYFIAEGLATQRWRIEVKIPSSILTIDDTEPQSMSSYDRILSHYHGIFENAPETEYIKQISEEEEKQARIKFQHASLSYKIYYTPWDIISKLPTRSLHFFCALDHLQQEVEINFSKLQHKDNENDNVLVIECPFNCIMRHANYINAIERIVQEKKSMLRELQEVETPQQLLNLAMGISTVTVQPTNMLTLVRMLESFWAEKELAFERKDLGKIAATLKTKKTIDWHQMCSDILAYNSNDDDALFNDEYEPTLSKDDRLTRVADVFVVNLPTLSLSISPQLQDNTDIIQYEGVAVPKIIVETAIQKDSILQKVKDDSTWKYTENTFETLKPTLQELNFNAMETQHLEEIHDFIMSSKLGVSVVDLMHEFPYDEFLLRALQTLSKHYLIKRVGVSTFMYVHKLHIRPWLVHTFHIKRLERDQLGSTASTARQLKRKRTDAEVIDDNEETEGKKPKKCKWDGEWPDVFANDSEHLIEKKKRKLTQEETEQEPTSTEKDVVPAESAETEKRVSKPRKVFTAESAANAGKKTIKKDIVIMRPKPWIRLNGSVNRRALDRWMGSLLTECIARTGCFVNEILLRFPHMLGADAMFLLEILSDLKCIRLRQLKPIKVGLFSEYEDLKEEDASELYNPENTFVIAQLDALSKLAIFIGKKKYSTEFI